MRLQMYNQNLNILIINMLNFIKNTNNQTKSLFLC